MSNLARIRIVGNGHRVNVYDDETGEEIKWIRSLYFSAEAGKEPTIELIVASDTFKFEGDVYLTVLNDE